MPQKQELKKHVAAVHINNKLSLLQRKIANVLLLNAYDNLLSLQTHSIRLATLCEMVGFDSHDQQTVKDALHALASTILQWNILDDQGENEWGVSTMLAQATIKRGICTYEYSSALRDKLYNPDIYARINISIQRKFSSGHALALYENCVRFKNIGTTGWVPVETLRKLLGVPESEHYDAFKNVNREILKKAVREINETSDIILSMDYQKERRKVTGVRFNIKRNPQLSLPLPNSPQDALKPSAVILEQELLPEHPLREQLLALGLTVQQANEVLKQYEKAYIEAVLAIVERDYETGKVKNLPAYTLAALREDYRPKKTLYVRACDTAKDTAKERRAKQTRRLEELHDLLKELESDFERGMMREVLDSLSLERKKKLERTFVEETQKEGGIILKFLKKGGIQHKVVHGAFLAFLKGQFIDHWKQSNFVEFVRQRGHDLMALKQELGNLQNAVSPRSI